MNLEQAIDYFRGGVARDRIAQAYLIVSTPDGVGRAFAVAAMQMLMCERPGVACGACKACRSVAERRHPDAVWIEPANRSRQIAIEQVRDLMHDIYRTSFANGWKSVTMLWADRLTTQAANAFLKTLEEPPARSLFLLLTDRPDALPPTVVSRCQRITIGDPNDGRLTPELEAKLAEILTLTDPKSYLARSSRGDRLAREIKEMVDEKLKEFHEAASDVDEEVDEETEEAREALIRRGLQTEILRSLSWWYRDILLLTSGADESLIRFQAYLDRLRAVADGTTQRKALRDVAEIDTMRRQLDRNLRDALVFGRAFAELN